ncbi:MAG TPA: hypothetical protein VFL84_05215 [Gammaproteobacteria bacterium]|nr:hypothetical protein [Gammaproteobacteria bacterium]
MNTRSIVVLVVVGTAAIAAVGLWRASLSVGDTERVASDFQTPASASASASAASTNGDNAPTEALVIDPAWRTPSSPSPRYAEPEEIERQLEQFIAEQPGLEIVSLSSIECGATTCEIALTGTEVNPRYVDAYSELNRRLSQGPWTDFIIRSGGLSTREIAPGAREYVIGFDYRPYVDLSADPLIAARQYAACAAFWRQQTEFPAPDDVVRGYLERVDHYVALAASVLGEDEAARIAADNRGAPVIRGCW